MAWTDPVDIYCERLEPGIWAEPVNALTNLAFVISALWVYPRVKGDLGAQVLCFVLAGIGICSGLFHTLANGWSAAADTSSILVFILIYIYLAAQRVLGFWRIWAVISVMAFIPYAALAASGFEAIFGPLNGSIQYLPVTLLIVFFGFLIHGIRPELARGFYIGAGLLIVSLTFRSIDQVFCTRWPMGTHFGWHILNAIMLGWMILLIRSAGLAKAVR